jgi:uncharacterized 2Fe-2S/4Fe-4S cluster protein (DUF4445 family)
VTKFLIDLEPVGRRIEVEAGTSLLEAAQQAGVDLVAACGGIGICGTCRVRPVRGDFNPLTPSEEEQLEPSQRAAGDRLACQAVPQGDTRVEVPPESLPAPQRIQLEGREGSMALEPAVRAVELTLAPPALDDLRADLGRVEDALAAGLAPSDGMSLLDTDLAALGQLSQELRKQDWKVRLALEAAPGGARLIGTFAPHTPLLGLAVDLGSTKLALYLIDLESGATLAQAGVMNPQIAYGEDVVNRIAFANRSAANRRLLQTRVVEALNQAAAQLCARAVESGRLSLAGPAQIVEAVVVGNTAMHHFFTHLPVEQLGAAPYVAAASRALAVGAAELGLAFAPGARVYLPDIIAGYVGGDHTAALLATRTFPGMRRVLVDIGTNTEISLVADGQIFTCSTASGPAFEGAHIHDGMRAAPGAIERVHLIEGRVQVATIGGLAPVGICGSGILQAVAQLAQAGVIDRRGALRKDAPGVRQADGKSEFLLVPAALSGHGRDVVVARRDINEIQLAKGAIRAGIEIMLHKAGLTAEDVEEWVIAGAFGTYLDLTSAVQVGMFPAMPLERFHQVGNAAGMGAKQMLLSSTARAEATRLARSAHYVELTVEPEFTGEFVQAMYL